ncbi:hypothetical protein BGX38DRAFT_1241498 [Terfezia claveryi]|nr:hypothetical protein BGX38DRAFT_1241498 [Terfezia claveryi]
MIQYGGWRRHTNIRKGIQIFIPNTSQQTSGTPIWVRPPHSGYVFTFAGAAISWKSRQ